MKIGVINRVIGVPPSGTNGTLVGVSLHEQYPASNDATNVISYAGGFVKLGGNIYYKFTSDVEGILFVLGYGTQEWELVDPTTYVALPLEDQTVIIGTNCIRFITPISATYDSVVLKVRNAIEWYYQFTNELAVPTFVSLGYLVNEFPTDIYLAYSLNKLEENATLCVRVRRSSDGAEQDIGFDGNYIDTAALQAFCGVNNGFVVTLYNQVTNGASGNLTSNTYGYRPKIWNGSSLMSYTNNGNTNSVIDMQVTDSSANTGRLFTNTLDFTNCANYQIAGVMAATNPTAGRLAGMFSISTGPGGSETARVHCGQGNGSAIGRGAKDVYSSAATTPVIIPTVDGRAFNNKMTQISISIKAATDDGFGGSNGDGEYVRAYDSWTENTGTFPDAGIATPDTDAPTGTLRVGYSIAATVTGGVKFCELVVWKGDTYNVQWETIGNFQRAMYQTE